MLQDQSHHNRSFNGHHHYNRFVHNIVIDFLFYLLPRHDILRLKSNPGDISRKGEDAYPYREPDPCSECLVVPGCSLTLSQYVLFWLFHILFGAGLFSLFSSIKIILLFSVRTLIPLITLAKSGTCLSFTLKFFSWVCALFCNLWGLFCVV